MSTTEQPEVSTGSTGSTEGGAAPAKDGAGQLKETERVQAGPGGPGRGPFGGGMVGQKAHDFKPNAKRLISRMAPERTKAIGVIILAVASVGLMSLGPRILGRATDLIFAGLTGRQLAATVPAGTSQQQVVDGFRQQGDDKHASMIASLKHFVVGQGIDFTAVAHVLMLALGVYVAASVLSWLQGYLLNDVVQGTVYRMRSEVEDKVNALPLELLRPAATR